MPIFQPKVLPQLASAAPEMAEVYGTKGGFLASIPSAWTPVYILISADIVKDIARGNFLSISLPSELKSCPLIVRSSVVGETIWDRGTFLSIVLDPVPSDDDIREAIRTIWADAQSKSSETEVGIIVQRFLSGCTKGTVGNLNRLSKTREHWSRFVEVDGFETAPERFNSQRDVPSDPKSGLNATAGRSIDRLFGSACRWIIDRFGSALGRDRLLLEWAMVSNKLYILQIDFDEENIIGLDPSKLPLITKLSSSSSLPTILKEVGRSEIETWDKLKILDDLSICGTPPAQKLFLLTYEEALSTIDNAEKSLQLIADFNSFFGRLAIIRVSRRVGSDKTHNLPCTSKCLTGEAAISWIRSEIDLFNVQGGSPADRAFIIHKYIGARSGAWALYDPGSPYIQVNANWGLPDSLQSYPYDAWDVHVVTEEITASLNFKSHFLWPDDDGEWVFQQIRNSIGRRPCLRNSEVLDIALKTHEIGNRLGRRVSIMWFAGVETEAGARICLPWYRTFDYAPPNLETTLNRDHVVVPIRSPEDLRKAIITSNNLIHPRSIALDIKPSEHLVRDTNFLDSIIEVSLQTRALVVYSGSPLAHAFFQLQGKVPVHLRLQRRSFRSRNRIKYHKLVRDHIPERIKAKHERVVYAALKSDEILRLLVGKLIEEAQELITAQGSDATIEELADIYEVLRGMMHQAGVDEQSVFKAADLKREKAGGFDRGMFLLETSLPKPGESIDEIRELTFNDLVKEEFVRGGVRIPFSLLGGLTSLGDRVFRVPGSDQAIKISPSRDGLEFSLEKQPKQFEIQFPDDDDMDD